MLFRFNNYKLDTELFTLHHNDKPCSIEPQVFDLLVYLIENRDRIISRQALLEALWGGKVVTESTLSSCIKATRQTIGDSGKKQQCIATLNRRGYRFIAEVESIEQHTDSAQTQGSGNSSQFDRPSIAVLPFAYSHDNNAMAWTAEMLSEDINIQLARIPGFIVVSRNSTSYYRGQDISISQIGKELGTDYIVDGSVRETGENLRLSVQLLECASGRFLWANRTEMPAEELVQFQNDVVYKIISHIEPELNRAELSVLKRRRPVDLDAWALYRQGHATLSLKGWSEESFRESADLLRQAIARDPELAFAHAYLALMLAIGHLVGLVNHKDWHIEATKAAETAIALDSQDSDVLGYAGCAFADMGDLTRGMVLMRRAIELDPSNAQAHAALGAAKLLQGEIDGIEVMRHGMRISPRDSRLAAWGALLARSLLSLGMVNEAIEEAEQACRRDDKIFLPRLVLAVAQNTAGNSDGARAALEEARRIRPHLAEADIARFASQDEIDSLKRDSLL